MAADVKHRQTSRCKKSYSKRRVVEKYLGSFPVSTVHVSTGAPKRRLLEKSKTLFARQNKPHVLILAEEGRRIGSGAVTSQTT